MLVLVHDLPFAFKAVTEIALTISQIECSGVRAEEMKPRVRWRQIICCGDNCTLHCSADCRSLA